MPFSFGNTSSTTPSTGFSFGNTKPATATATSANTSFSFGNTAKPAATTGTSSGFSFGNTASAAKPATSTGFSFGSTASTSNAAASNNAVANFSFSTLPDTAQEKKPATAGVNLGLGGTSAATDAKTAQPVGILKKTNADEKKDDAAAANDALDDKKKNILQEQIPKEIFADTKALEQHIETSLNVRSANIQKTSTRSNFDKVAKKIKSTQSTVSQLSSQVRQIQSDTQNLISNYRRIRDDAMVAQNTDGMARALQFENTAPLEYLYRQVERFHSEVQQYDRDIKEVECVLAMRKNVKSLEETNLSGNDLVKILDRCQSSFLKVACQYFKVHNTMQETKSQYITYRHKKFPTKTPLVFSNVSAKNEQKLIESFDDIKVNKAQKTDVNQSPFSAYNAHILANIVKANITKNITNPNQTQATGATNCFGNNNATANPPGTSSGFSFGNTANKTATTTGGFSFGNTNKTSTTGGFSFGNTASKPASTSGFSFGNTAAATGASTAANTGGASTGFSFGNTASKPATTGTTGGFSFGSTAAKTTGFSFGKT